MLTERQAMDRLVADLDARPPHLGQAARHHRHGTDRPGGGAPRPRLRPADPLSQPPPRAGEGRGGARPPPIGRASTRCSPAWTSSRSTARTRRRPITCSRRAGSSCIRPEAYIVNTARGEVIDENALVRLIADGRDRRRRPRRVRARAGGEPASSSSSRARARWCCCRIWARPRSRAASTWARRSSSTSRPSSTGTGLPDRVLPSML